MSRGESLVPPAAGIDPRPRGPRRQRTPMTRPNGGRGSSEITSAPNVATRRPIGVRARQGPNLSRDRLRRGHHSAGQPSKMCPFCDRSASARPTTAVTRDPIAQPAQHPIHPEEILTAARRFGAEATRPGRAGDPDHLDPPSNGARSMGMTYPSHEPPESVPDLMAELSRIRAAIRPTRKPASPGSDEVTGDDLFRLYARERQVVRRLRCRHRQWRTETGISQRQQRSTRRAPLRPT